MQTTDFIWFDGKMVPWADAQVHVLTHALHYGSAVSKASAPMPVLTALPPFSA